MSFLPNSDHSYHSARILLGSARNVWGSVKYSLDPDAGATVTVRSYSDVVASRPPSPRREIPVQPVRSAALGPSGAEILDHPFDGGHVDNTSSYNNNSYNSSEEIVETPDKEDSHWTTVVPCKRACSHGSLGNKRPLTTEQAQMVRLATENLTQEQMHHLQRRQEKVRPRRGSSVSSRGEGPSKPKGKGIDPREWGNVNISRESLDIEAQAAALRSFSDQRQSPFEEESFLSYEKRVGSRARIAQPRTH